MLLTSRAIARLGPVHQARGISTRPTVAAAAAAAAAAVSAPMHIVGVSGSLRAASVNTGLLRSIAANPPPGITFEIASIADLPLYNDDLWQGLDRKNDDSLLPPAVRGFRAKIKAADAVLFATPEYNHSLTGPLKNAIDWTSKGPCLWTRKPVAAVGAAGGSLAARSAQALYLTITSCGAIYPPAGGYVWTSAFGKTFNEKGDVVDPAVAENLTKVTAGLAEWAAKFKTIM